MARHKMIPPVVTTKHYVQQTNVSLASGAVAVVSLIDGVARGDDRTATNQVDEGSVIKAVYIEWWLNGSGASNATTQFDFIVYKNPGPGTNITATELLNLASWDNKKNIFFTTHGVLGPIGNQSIPILRQWILIPKGKQRFGLNDRIQIGLTSTGTALQHCGFSTYKEFN